jgi:hypothetical protein
MVQFKVLILIVAGFISINSCDKVRKTSKCDEIIFYNSNDKVSIEINEYNLINNKVGFDLVILDSLKLNKLLKIVNPSVEFCVENKKNIAKGNFIFNSSVPLNAKYFFPLDKNNKVYLFKGNVLTFKKI